MWLVQIKKTNTHTTHLHCTFRKWDRWIKESVSKTWNETVAEPDWLFRSVSFSWRGVGGGVRKCNWAVLHTVFLVAKNFYHSFTGICIIFYVLVLESKFCLFLQRRFDCQNTNKTASSVILKNHTGSRLWHVNFGAFSLHSTRDGYMYTGERRPSLRREFWVWFQ